MRMRIKTQIFSSRCAGAVAGRLASWLVLQPERILIIR